MKNITKKLIIIFGVIGLSITSFAESNHNKKTPLEPQRKQQQNKKLPPKQNNNKKLKNNKKQSPKKNTNQNKNIKKPLPPK